MTRASYISPENTGPAIASPVSSFSRDLRMIVVIGIILIEGILGVVVMSVAA